MSGIDVIAILDTYGVTYRQSGKNVMREHVAVACPLPNCGDRSAHCNLKVDGSHVICFVCGFKGGVREVIKILKLLTPIKKMSDFLYRGLDFKAVTRYNTDESIFEGLWTAMPELSYKHKRHCNYLEQRGLSVDFCINFGMRVGTGVDANRIFIPIKDESGRVVNYVGRHIGLSQIRYKNAPSNLAIKRAGELLFGLYESRQILTDYVIIVEGIFDVLACLHNEMSAVGLMKMQITDTQLNLLYNNFRKKRWIVCLDSGVDMTDIIGRLSAFNQDVSGMLLLNSKDLGELSKSVLNDVKQLLNKGGEGYEIDTSKKR